MDYSLEYRANIEEYAQLQNHISNYYQYCSLALHPQVHLHKLNLNFIFYFNCACAVLIWSNLNKQ
jgi:hypothetical protein